MKSIKAAFLVMALACIFLGCKKGGEEEETPSCEENHTASVTFKNTGTQPLKVVVSPRLNAQFEPVEPFITETLAPGAQIVREVPADNNVISWYKNCSTTCATHTQQFRDYEACGEFEEAQGL